VHDFARNDWAEESPNQENASMNQKLNLGLSLIAGLLGGILSHAVSPQMLRAQEQTPPSKTITAERFVLTDEHGTAAGVFGFKDGKPIITLFDSTGRVTWSTEIRPAPVRQ
jgi:hypothetical protein